MTLVLAPTGEMYVPCAGCAPSVTVSTLVFGLRLDCWYRMRACSATTCDADLALASCIHLALRADITH